MNLSEYLSKEERGRRIIACGNVARGNSLLRTFEKETGKHAENVSFVSFEMLYKELFNYFESEYGYTPRFSIIDDAEGAMLLRSTAFDNLNELAYFGDEKMLSVATCNEIYSKINLVRGNGWNGKEDRASSRVSDINLLIEKYEERLASQNLLDRLSLIQYLCDKLSSCKSTSEEIALCLNAEIAVIKEDTEKLTLLEKEFIKELSRLATGDALEICIFDKDPREDALTPILGKVNLFKAYGSFNEASFVCCDIVEKNLPLGDTALLYTSDSQLDAIESAFKGNGISAAFTSSKNLKGNMYVSLARRIIAFAMDNFSEKALESVFASPALKNEYKDAASGNIFNAAGGKSYFGHILNARARRGDSFILGWGYERNLDFVAHEKPLADERGKAALEIHEALLEIFGAGGKLFDGANAVKPSVIYEKLLAFLWKFQNKSGEIAEGKGALDNLKGTVALEDRKLSLSENLEYVDDLLKGLTSSADAKSDELLVSKLSDWQQIERKHLYITGLSLKEMQESTTQSPVLSDDEMREWLTGGYIPTVENRTHYRNLNLFRTLNNFKGDDITFGYSSYDTVLFGENSPSIFFRDTALKKGISISDLPEFVYGNPLGTVSGKSVSYSLKADYKIKLSTSNSSIEKLLDCPKKYYYSEIARIPDGNFTECEQGKWLDALRYGSLFHVVAERYVKEVFIKPVSESYSSLVDTALLEKIVNEEADKMLLAFPAPSVKQKEFETAEFLKTCISYFEKVHTDILGDDLGWRMLMTEKRFDDEPYHIDDYLGNGYDFLFRGEIDRVDYFVDNAAKNVTLRIADYKTGKRSGKEESCNLGMVVQHAIYKKALMGTLLPEVMKKIAELEGNPATEKYNAVFSDFTYHFPKEAEEYRLVIPSTEVEGLNVSRLKAELTAIKSLSEYPDHYQLYAEIEKYASSYLHLDPSLGELLKALSSTRNGITKMKSAEKKLCEYCDYRELCPAVREGRI